MPEETNVISDEKLAEKLENSPAERVTKEYILSRIAGKPTFIQVDGTVTICHIKLDNGFSVRGESACVKAENYDQEIGQKISYENAFDKLWAFFGFMLAENGTLKK